MLHNPADHPARTEHAQLATEVSGGLDGAMRVLSMLRARQYSVLSIEMDFSSGSKDRGYVRCELDLEPHREPMLLARLERMPVVITTQIHHGRARAGR